MTRRAIVRLCFLISAVALPAQLRSQLPSPPFATPYPHLPLPSEEATPFSSSLSPTPFPSRLVSPGSYDEAMASGQMEYIAGHYDKVIDLCDTGLEKVKGKYASALLDLRGRAYQGKGDVAHAMADYNDALKENPKNIRALCDRGWLYAVKKQYPKGFKDFNEAITLGPKAGWLYHTRGKVYASKGDYEKAIADYEKTVELDSNNWRPYNSVAWVLATCRNQKVRNGAEALDYATKACALTDWKNSEAIDTFSAACAEAGDFAAAIKWEQIAITTPVSASRIDGYTARLALYQANNPYRDERPMSLKLATSSE